MKKRGLIYVPYGLGLVQIMMNYPPVTLVLTQKSWGLTMNNKVQPNISIGSIGDVNGPINVGGEQIVIFGQRMSGDDLRALVAALRQDAKNSLNHALLPSKKRQILCKTLLRGANRRRHP